MLLEKLTGETPAIEYAADYARIYYHPDKLKMVQKKLQKMSTASPGDIRVDWFPMIVPMAIKKALPFAAGLFFLGYLIGGRND